VNIWYPDDSGYRMVHLSFNWILITGRPFNIWTIGLDVNIYWLVLVFRLDLNIVYDYFIYKTVQPSNHLITWQIVRISDHGFISELHHNQPAIQYLKVTRLDCFLKKRVAHKNLIYNKKVQLSDHSITGCQ
jgi:hypothetical protein